jgi:flagellar hook-basal body complex protein FliE
MPLPPIDPTFVTSGPEWSVGSVGSVGDAGQIGSVDQAGQGGAAAGGFGDMLTNAVSKLDQTQTDAAGAARTLVDGTATDPSTVVMQVERAQLAMQLASQIRNKAVEAYQDVFHTQV